MELGGPLCRLVAFVAAARKLLYHNSYDCGRCKTNFAKLVERKTAKNAARSSAKGQRVSEKIELRRQPVQISLLAMILMMVIFSLMSIGLLYATRVEAIQDELAMILGPSWMSNVETSRRSHLAFLMFTYVSPLLLAMVISTVVGLRRKLR